MTSKDEEYSGKLTQREMLYEAYKDKIQVYENNEGRKLSLEVKALEGSYEVYAGNYVELKSLLVQIDDPDVSLPMWDEAHPERFDQVDKEIRRLLHNYLASVQSLVDHTRNLMKNYAGTSFSSEYQKRIDQSFKDKPLPSFVQDLRNFTLHRNLPATSATLEFKRQEDGNFHTKNSFNLDIAKLKDWKKWSPASRKYIGEVGDEVSLDAVIDSYGELVEALYNWFGERIEQENAASIKEMKELEKQIQHLQSRLQ